MLNHWKEQEVAVSLRYQDLICHLELPVTVGALTGTFLGDRGSVASWCLAPIHCDRLQQRVAWEYNPELVWAR